MGLAASQARFLGITARKSNIEYEGQQVNQQRTALAEEVNALYSSLIALEAPIPPDTTQFYESDYSFEIKSTANENNGKFRVLEYGENPVGKDGKTSYYAYVERTYTDVVAIENDLDKNGYVIKKDKDGKYYLENEGKKSPLTPITDEDENKNLRELIKKTTGVSDIAEDETFYSYEVDGKKYYLPASIIIDEPETTPEAGTGTTTTPGTGTETETTPDTEVEDAIIPTINNQIYSFHKGQDTFVEKKTFDPVDIEFDNNGRPQKITIDGYEYSVSATRYHDDEAYQAALRDYTMEKDEYNKMVADLNARTESLQQEDKVLELRLNQIDTEQQQLSTELEAVKNVLKENIESTFKTFS